MNQPSVSIIVPVYNVEPYVEDCIRSVMRQTYNGPMECIIVDDCGTDNSMAVVKRTIAEYNGTIEFTILHHEHNRGLSAARNTGMEAATGDYLLFLDSDDELADDCLERLTEALEKDWYDMVVGDASRFEKNSANQWHKITSKELNISEDILLRSPMTLNTLGIKWKWSAWGKLYRKNFVSNNNLSFKEGLLFEDILWGFKNACLASSIFLLNKSIYKYKYREGSILHPFDIRKKIEALIEIVKDMGDFTTSYNIDMTLALPIINKFFCEILVFHYFSLSSFVSIYKELRPYLKVTIKNIIQANGFHIRAYFHDFHYMLPTFIAPYWHYFVYRKVCSVVSQIRKR